MATASDGGSRFENIPVVAEMVGHSVSVSGPFRPTMRVATVNAGAGVEMLPRGVTPPDRPVASELAEAVRLFLEQELLPTLADHRLRFRTLVAMNALSIVAREAPPPAPPSEEDRVLAARLRAGDVRDADLVFLKHKAREKLALASPRYLERYEQDAP